MFFLILKWAVLWVVVGSFISIFEHRLRKKRKEPTLDDTDVAIDIALWPVNVVYLVQKYVHIPHEHRWKFNPLLWLFKLLS